MSKQHPSDHFMNIRFSIGFAAILCAGLSLAQAQLGAGTPGLGPQGGMSISPATARLFGENAAFTANMEMEATMGAQSKILMPSRLAFDLGKSRMDMDLTNLRGSAVTPDALTQVRQLGMAQMTMISRPDKQLVYLVFPTIRTYVEVPTPKGLAGQRMESMTLSLRELARETVGSQPTIKNKAIVTDSTGKQTESTIWNSLTLKQFPIKIETTEQGTPVTINFRNVALGRQPAAAFEPPAGFMKYTNMMEMMQVVMSKQLPPGSQPPRTNRPAPPQSQPPTR
jgi:hypothetical protein